MAIGDVSNRRFLEDRSHLPTDSNYYETSATKQTPPSESSYYEGPINVASIQEQQPGTEESSNSI